MPKKWKGGTLLPWNGFLEALDAFKMRFVKVHSAQKWYIQGEVCGPTKKKNTGTSKVGAISKAQKAQSFQNCKREEPTGCLKIQFVAEYQKK